MKKLLIATSLICMSSFAMAHGCPGEMKKIDNALPTAKLTPQNISKVKELRAKGEEQHKAGQHTESMNTLAEAKKIVGVQ
jgi:hypothetical protein